MASSGRRTFQANDQPLACTMCSLLSNSILYITRTKRLSQYCLGQMVGVVNGSVDCCMGIGAFFFIARVNATAQAEFISGKRHDKPRFLDLYRTGFTLGNCLALGWLEEAKTLARRMNTGLDHGWFFDGTCNTIQRRTQHFVLRLVANWQGWPERTELPCVYDVPVFNALIEQWRTPDVQALCGLLLQTLDRHAEQTQSDNDDICLYRDCNGPDQIYNPMEVLSVLRLREELGLPNPDMPKHPVTDTPLGRALLPASPFPKDELLERVLARVRREYPDFLTA
jgi:hypothetical protein